jgi:hypothetical protein
MTTIPILQMVLKGILHTQRKKKITNKSHQKTINFRRKKPYENERIKHVQISKPEKPLRGTIAIEKNKQY